MAPRQSASLRLTLWCPFCRWHGTVRETWLNETLHAPHHVQHAQEGQWQPVTVRDRRGVDLIHHVQAVGQTENRKSVSVTVGVRRQGVFTNADIALLAMFYTWWRTLLLSQGFGWKYYKALADSIQRLILKQLFNIHFAMQHVRCISFKASTIFKIQYFVFISLA